MVPNPKPPVNRWRNFSEVTENTDNVCTIEDHILLRGFRNLNLDWTTGGRFCAVEDPPVNRPVCGLHKKQLLTFQAGHLRPIDGNGLDDIRKAEVEHATV